MAGLEIGEDFPLVCEACLGPNPYVRMTKSPNGTECKISKRPCTMFEWRANGVKKQTCISYAVAAQKNICQCCMTDLTFGLPVGVRDAFLKKAIERGVEGVNETFGTLPKSRVGQDYLFNQLADAKASAQAGTLLLKDDSTEAISSLMKGAVAHTQGFDGFKFRLPPICAAWLNGSCKQKRNCPNRPCCGLYKFPELSPKQAEQLEGDLKSIGPDRISLSDDVKRRLQSKVDSDRNEANREGSRHDHANKTLFVSKLGPEVNEAALKSSFAKFSGVTRISLSEGNDKRSKVAFIEFDTRANAEFVLSLSGLMVGSSSAQLSWARPKPTNNYGQLKGRESGKDRVDDETRHAFSSVNNKKAEQNEEEERNKRPKMESSTTKSPVGPQKEKIPPAPQALLAALQMRKQKGLDDDD